MADFELTKEEQNAINSLKRLAKRWPETLWLYSASGSLNVMRYPEDINNGAAMTADGGVDQDYSITTINIENDGGDW